MNSMIKIQVRIITFFGNYKHRQGICNYEKHDTLARNSFNAIVYKQPPLLLRELLNTQIKPSFDNCSRMDK